MNEEIDRLVIAVRTDTAGFNRDIADMRATLEGPLTQGADMAGRGIETALLRATRSGKLGFDDLKNVALSALSQIAASALHSGLDALLGGGSAGGGGGGGLFGALSLALGLPGRATGGPVSPGRPYVVGERGPELFVPTSSGAINTAAAPGGRDVRVAITINASPTDQPQSLARSSRQIARAVRQAVESAG